MPAIIHNEHAQVTYIKSNVKHRPVIDIVTELGITKSRFYHLAKKHNIQLLRKRGRKPINPPTNDFWERGRADPAVLHAKWY